MLSSFKRCLRSNLWNLALLVSFMSVLSSLQPHHACALSGVKEGEEPKEVVLSDLAGRVVNVSELFGKKPVILLFWKQMSSDAYLDYSQDQLRFLNRHYKKFRDDKGLEIFGIYTPQEFTEVSEEELNTVRSLVDANGIEFPVLVDKGFRMFREYGVVALPSTVMVAQSGKVHFVYPSFPLSARSMISDRISDLVGVTTGTADRGTGKAKAPATRAGRLYNYALQMYKKGLIEQSRSALKKAIDLNPEDPWPHNLSGIILWEKKLYVQAGDSFKKALALDSDNHAARMNYAVILIEQKNYSEAEKTLGQTLSDGADVQARAHHLRGIVYSSTGRLEEANTEFKTALDKISEGSGEPGEQTPEYYSLEVSLLHGLSVLSSKKGEHEKALEYLGRAFIAALGMDGSLSVENFASRHDVMVYE